MGSSFAIFRAFPFRARHFKGGGRDVSPACGGCRIKWRFARRAYLRRQIYVTKILSRKHFASSSEWAVHYSPRMKDHAAVAVQQSCCVVADAVSQFTCLSWIGMRPGGLHPVPERTGICTPSLQCNMAWEYLR